MMKTSLIITSNERIDYHILRLLKCIIIGTTRMNSLLFSLLIIPVFFYNIVFQTEKPRYIGILQDIYLYVWSQSHRISLIAHFLFHVPWSSKPSTDIKIVL